MVADSFRKWIGDTSATLHKSAQKSAMQQKKCAFFGFFESSLLSVRITSLGVPPPPPSSFPLSVSPPLLLHLFFFPPSPPPPSSSFAPPLFLSFLSFLPLPPPPSSVFPFPPSSSFAIANGGKGGLAQRKPKP